MTAIVSGLRQRIKNTTLGLWNATGVNSWVASRRRGRLWIPCYHGVVSAERPQRREGYENTVSVKAFTQQLEWMSRHYRFVDLEGALRWLEDPDDGRAPVLLSFDDGYRNNLTLAAPVLRRMGIPAVFFLSTNYVGEQRMLWPLELDARLEQSAGMRIYWPGKTSEEVVIPAAPPRRHAIAMHLRQILKTIPNQERVRYLVDFRQRTRLDLSRIDRELNDFLSWDEARQLAGLGFDIGSHTQEHPILSRLEDTELSEELSQSKARLERELGRPVLTLAYPNGGSSDYSPTVIESAKACGYQAAFAVGDRWQAPLRTSHPDERFALGRVIVPGHLSPATFPFIASGARDLVRGAVGRFAVHGKT